jgi:hypothetical protein
MQKKILPLFLRFQMNNDKNDKEGNKHQTQNKKDTKNKQTIIKKERKKERNIS